MALREPPTPKSQTPKKHQTSNPNTSLQTRRPVWNLGPGVYLEFGFWNLEFSPFSPITLSHHEIERAQDADHIAHHVAGQNVRQDAQVHERRSPNLEAVG